MLARNLPQMSPTSTLLPLPAASALACGQLLLNHLEPLELALGDPATLEQAVQDLLDAAVTLRGHEPLAKDSQPAHGLPEPGQVVWQHVARADRKPEAGTVQCTFRGKDGRYWSMLEMADEDGAVRYSTRPVLALSLTAEGPGYLREALSQPAFAREFLRRAGIVDEEGRLTS